MISQNPVSGKCRLGPLVSPRSVAGRSPQARPALGETRFIKPSRRETWHQDNYGSNTRRSRPENEYEDDRSARSNHSCPGMAGRSGRRHMAGSWGRRVGRRRHQGHSRTDVPRIDRRELRDLGPWRESPEDDRMCPVCRHPLVPVGHRGRRPPAGFRRAAQTSRREVQLGTGERRHEYLQAHRNRQEHRGGRRPAGLRRSQRAEQLGDYLPGAGRRAGQVVDTGREAPERPLPGGQDAIAS